jgi:hypothetical protein
MSWKDRSVECAGAKQGFSESKATRLIGQLRVLSYVCPDGEAVRVDTALLPRAREQLSVSP